MFYGTTERKRYTKWRIDLAIHDALAISRKRSFNESMQRLLDVTLSRSALLRPYPTGGCAGWAQAELFLRGLVALCEYRRSWLRDAYDWEVKEGSPIQQFGSLARHLLVRHSVPNFMPLVWLEEPSEAASRHQKLFKHLGLGNSIRGANLPIRFTKAMADFFGQAPDHLTVEQAIRWSQVRGLGGDQRMASTVVATRLGTVFGNESFWERILLFLITRPKLEIDDVPAIIDYIDVHRDSLADEPFHRMNGRSFGSFLHRVRRWLDRNPNYGRRATISWHQTSIRGFRHFEPQKHQWSVRFWTIRELSNSEELREEGNDLHHCVGSYTKACANRITSIWSMRCHGSLQNNRMLTIEVNPNDRVIVRALGKCNAQPTPDARRIMQMWAEQEGLTMARWM